MPAIAEDGIETDRVGFHDAELTPLPPVRVKATRGTLKFIAFDGPGWPGVKVPMPDADVTGPDQ